MGGKVSGGAGVVVRVNRGRGMVGGMVVEGAAWVLWAGCCEGRVLTDLLSGAS